MKKLLKDILVIILISTVIAIAYNFFSSKPLPWFREDVKIEVVHDTLLTIKAIDSSAAQPADTIIPQTPVDSIIKEDIIKDETIEAETIDTAVIEEKIVSQNNETSSEVKTLTYEQVVEHLEDPDFLFVDARPENEWLENKIGGAINIMPPYDGDNESYFKKLMSLPRDKIIIVYCSGGSCESSHKVAGDLLAFGYPKVFLYSGGWDEWTKKRGL